MKNVLGTWLAVSFYIQQAVWKRTVLSVYFIHSEFDHVNAEKFRIRHLVPNA